MSLKALPLLFLNMGGEMCYILDQRLQAQNVRREKASRVLSDIVTTMFNAKFLEELFKPQEHYSKRAMRTLFDKLAHSSIMRLNSTSMDKLYDLMTMAVKYQLQNCLAPSDLLLMTMNHLDGVRKLVQGSSSVQQQVDHAYKLLKTVFFGMNQFELQLIRQTLLVFYQDVRVKVSILLRDNRQRDDGRFVVATKTRLGHGVQAPGIIRLYVNGKPSRTIAFSSGGVYSETAKTGSLDITARTGDRITELGTNMYKNQSADTQGGFGSSYGGVGGGGGGGGADANYSNPSQHQASKDTLVKEELRLLSLLVQPGAAKADDFALSLFDTQQDEESFVAAAAEAAKSAAAASNLIKIDASKRDSAVEKLVGDMAKASTKPKKARGDDLLDLMDASGGR